MSRAYYSTNVGDFLKQDNMAILGTLSQNNQFTLETTQRNTWMSEIVILKETLVGFETGTIIFEYTIPSIGKRIDNVLLFNGVCYLIEFKGGETSYPNYAVEQVVDYALDLKNFHKESHNIPIIPILVATHAKECSNTYERYDDDIFTPILCNAKSLRKELLLLSSQYTYLEIDVDRWSNSIYMPTPTIIEAAQALYRGHDVKEISRNDAGASNLSYTTQAINHIIDDAKKHNKKSICFITGVPGAGKTLAGLNIANERHKFDENEHAVFLSGNGPLVQVLQEALSRDESAREGTSKKATIQKAKAFIQIIHHFRDDAISVATAPAEKVVIFDEAQRAWNKAQTTKFMQQKKGVADFNMSEPEFLISIMDRHEDWAVIVCLIGGGQEINTGEAGLLEWFNALKHHYSKWEVYLSDQIHDTEYIGSCKLADELSGINYNIDSNLHLSVSLRSFRSEKLAAFVKALLDLKKNEVREIYSQLKGVYPIVITRSLVTAKSWVRKMARGTERYGLVANSGARRLRTQGIWVQCGIDAANWFLNGKGDVRSSFYLEEAATEFDIQGLELDWMIMAWDINFRFDKDEWIYSSFKGTKWQNIHSMADKGYLKNAYRVLLTRARQGFVIYVPEGDMNDDTRKSSYYDGVWGYLKEIEIEEI